MVKQKGQLFTLSDSWVIEQSGKTLLITGGADAKYIIELESNDISFLSSLKNGDTFVRSGLDFQDQRILEQLITAGVIVPVLLKRPLLKLIIIGDIDGFNLYDTEYVRIVDDIDDCDFALLIRTNNTYAELISRVSYQNITKPHLFIDMAFHHTISVGPLVFPGETSCLGCLNGRITERWGDILPPENPRASVDLKDITIEIILIELCKITQGDTSLINKTISWNFQDRSVKSNQLLKVSLCPVCAKSKIDRNGSLMLPWLKDESTTDTI